MVRLHHAALERRRYSARTMRRRLSKCVRAVAPILGSALLVGACAGGSDPSAPPDTSSPDGLRTVHEALERTFEALVDRDVSAVIESMAEDCRDELGTAEEVAAELENSDMFTDIYDEYELDEVAVDAQLGPAVIYRYSLRGFWQLGEAGIFRMNWEKGAWRVSDCLGELPEYEDMAHGPFGATLSGTYGTAMRVDSFEWDQRDEQSGPVSFVMRACAPAELDGFIMIRISDFDVRQYFDRLFAEPAEPSDSIVLRSGECVDQQLMFEAKPGPNWGNELSDPRFDVSQWRVSYGSGLGWFAWGAGE
jgi:hypothetical protein